MLNRICFRRSVTSVFRPIKELGFVSSRWHSAFLGDTQHPKPDQLQGYRVSKVPGVEFLAKPLPIEDIPDIANGLVSLSESDLRWMDEEEATAFYVTTEKETDGTIAWSGLSEWHHGQYREMTILTWDTPPRVGIKRIFEEDLVEFTNNHVHQTGGRMSKQDIETWITDDVLSKISLKKAVRAMYWPTSDKSKVKQAKFRPVLVFESAVTGITMSALIYCGGLSEHMRDKYFGIGVIPFKPEWLSSGEVGKDTFIIPTLTFWSTIAKTGGLTYRRCENDVIGPKWKLQGVARGEIEGLLVDAYREIVRMNPLSCVVPAFYDDCPLALDMGQLRGVVEANDLDVFRFIQECNARADDEDDLPF